MATRSSHTPTSTSRAASSAGKRAADLLLLEELHGGLPIGMLIHAADTLQILRATPPLPGFADDERPLERQRSADGASEDDPRLPHELASLIREVAATGTPRQLGEFDTTAAGIPPRWWRATLHRIDTENWGPVVVTLTLELTERVRARDLLAEREARQRTLRQAIASLPGPLRPGLSPVQLDVVRAGGRGPDTRARCARDPCSERCSGRPSRRSPPPLSPATPPACG